MSYWNKQPQNSVASLWISRGMLGLIRDPGSAHVSAIFWGVVLKHEWASESPGGLFKTHRLLYSTPRDSDSVGLEGSPQNLHL